MAPRPWRDIVAALRGWGLATRVQAPGCLAARTSYRARRSFTLRQHLFVLVLAACVPLITVAALVSVDRFYSERKANRTSLMVNARALAAAVDSELDKYLAVIHTLSKSPALLNGDLRQFWQEAKDASAIAPGTWIIVGDRNHQQLANTLRPFGEQLPLRAARPWIDRAFATKQPQVSDVFRGAVADRSVVILRDGSPLYSLAISLGLDRFHVSIKAGELHTLRTAAVVRYTSNRLLTPQTCAMPAAVTLLSPKRLLAPTRLLPSGPERKQKKSIKTVSTDTWREPHITRLALAVGGRCERAGGARFREGWRI